MRNNDANYVQHLEIALKDAEDEIKYLEKYVREVEAKLAEYEQAETLSMIAEAEGHHKCGCCHG